MTKIKVLVVDDSFFMRKVLSDIINDNDSYQVIGTAKNGLEAIERIKELSPDVVTMDIEMPIMDGLTALQRIMKEVPVPVLMLSGLTKEGADATIKALDYGAVDFIPKPGNIFKVNVDDMRDEIYRKLAIASKLRVKTKQQAMQSIISNRGLATQAKPINHVKVKEVQKEGCNRGFRRKPDDLTCIVAIGTSTGGPRALQAIISSLPKGLNVPIVVVQHMPPGFTKSLAERLDNISQLSVKEAEDMDKLLNGWVYIAPGGKHIKVDYVGKDLHIRLDDGPKVSGHKPSVDVMTDSIADLDCIRKAGVILTGMGADGSEGLCKMKKMDSYIIAQDEASCVVFGMPKSAINKGIVDKVVPLNQVAKEIIDFVEVG